MTLVALLVASTPLALFMLTPLIASYGPHETTPWSEAVGGAFLVAAAIVVWPASGGKAGAHQAVPGPTMGSDAVVDATGAA